MQDFQLQNQSPTVKFSQSKLKQARSNDRATQDATDDFLTKLQTQAKIQARLEKKRILPHQADNIASFVGRYSWQSLLITSLITTILLEIFF